MQIFLFIYIHCGIMMLFLLKWTSAAINKKITNLWVYTLLMYQEIIVLALFTDTAHAELNTYKYVW